MFDIFQVVPKIWLILSGCHKWLRTNLAMEANSRVGFYANKYYISALKYSHPTDCSSDQTDVLTLRIFFSFLTWSTCFNLITSWIARIFSAEYSLVFLSRQRQTRANVPEMLIFNKMAKISQESSPCLSTPNIVETGFIFIFQTWMEFLSLSPQSLS